ncbi:hypothetical protein GMDG_04384 [Pseudogymnoascus destructans 20631-21]|uniref:Uncharacterized protein n=1 Tax=Pseudogymnoascus destructans (strain ATCC MYA-4855 / 20631-21) TaxID=658429 RepID=L8GCV2_PSED2|nr:hypothetical protein GMDG_04384 [Pseudogymnoascus destructans 20631-21]
MHSLLPSVYLLLTAAAVATCRQWEDCNARMDGHLPYYTPLTFSGRVRRYYVAAEVEPWNYLRQSFRAQTYGYIASDTSIGTKYDKGQYKGYTDASFRERTKQQEWLGLQGPIL